MLGVFHQFGEADAGASSATTPDMIAQRFLTLSQQVYSTASVTPPPVPPSCPLDAVQLRRVWERLQAKTASLWSATLAKKAIGAFSQEFNSLAKDLHSDVEADMSLCGYAQLNMPYGGDARIEAKEVVEKAKPSAEDHARAVMALCTAGAMELPNDMTLLGLFYTMQQMSHGAKDPQILIKYKAVGFDPDSILRALAEKEQE